MAGYLDSFTRIVTRTELLPQFDERHNFVHIKISKEHHDSLTETRIIMHTTCGTHPSGVLFALVIPICANDLFTLSIIYLGISIGRLFDF